MHVFIGCNKHFSIWFYLHVVYQHWLGGTTKYSNYIFDWIKTNYISSFTHFNHFFFNIECWISSHNFDDKNCYCISVFGRGFRKELEKWSNSAKHVANDDLLWLWVPLKPYAFGLKSWHLMWLLFYGPKNIQPLSGYTWTYVHNVSMIIGNIWG